MLVSPIQPGSPRGELIRDSAVIIWDEAPMANHAVLACVEETCQHVMENDSPFGNKIIVLLGDFRQTCPVIRRGSHAQIVDASIKSSPLWSDFTIHRLHRHWRNAGDIPFANFVDAIGDGAGPDVSLDMLDIVTDAEDIMQFVYPDHVLQNSASCLSRAILAPTNQQVDHYNDVILQRVHGTQHVYLAADTLKEANSAGLISPDSALDYAARQTPPGLPSHTLTVKVNGVYRLLRNFSLDRGLVKNVRVVVVDVGTRIVTVRLLRPGDLTNSGIGEDILIPRISFLHQLPSGHTLLRRQFPLAPAYATTFNSCQGLTLDIVGVDLTRPVFSHGQLYTALSRIRHHNDAKVRLRPGETTTPNVTYQEILI
jgi:ATP-dependent DNA helicase PIF1